MVFDRLAVLSAMPPERVAWDQEAGYVPPIFQILSDEEFGLLMAWFEDSRQAGFVGECGVAAISMLMSLIMGSKMSRIAQAGHYGGYSALLMGMMLRKMGGRRKLISFDIDQASTRFARSWIERAGLSDHVRLILCDSADPIAPAIAAEFLGGNPDLLFIDSSHQYRHTAEELRLWAGAIGSRGFICMHDASDYAMTFDPSGLGGVRRAALEWRAGNAGEMLTITGEVGNPHAPYGDPCGFGIIQMPARADPKLPAPRLASERRIIRDPAFDLADAWAPFKNEWARGSGATKQAQGSQALFTRGPIQQGERYRVSITVKDVQSGSFYVVLGGGGPQHDAIAASGEYAVEVLGGDHGVIAIVPSSDFLGTISSLDARQIG